MPDFLAVDPGVRTGVALMNYYHDTPVRLLLATDVGGGVEGFIEWIDAYQPATLEFIVYEDFILREGKHGVELEPLKVIGALHVLAHELEIPLHSQPPSGRLKAVNDEALNRLGMRFSGNKDRNVKEAARHGVWWMKRQGHVPTIKTAWPPDREEI